MTNELDEADLTLAGELLAPWYTANEEGAIPFVRRFPNTARAFLAKVRALAAKGKLGPAIEGGRNDMTYKLDENSSAVRLAAAYWNRSPASALDIVNSRQHKELWLRVVAEARKLVVEGKLGGAPPPPNNVIRKVVQVIPEDAKNFLSYLCSDGTHWVWKNGQWVQAPTPPGTISYHLTPPEISAEVKG